MSYEFAETAEWDWVYTAGRGGERLHHLAALDDPAKADAEWGGEGVASCGLRAFFRIPGFMWRMDAHRCARCCDRLGWPRGIGSPKNDPALRPLVIARIDGRHPTPTQHAVNPEEEQG